MMGARSCDYRAGDGLMRQSHTIVVVLLWLAASPSPAATSKIGRTWPIAEPDALTEIEGKAAKLPSLAGHFGPRSGWSAMRSAALGVAKESRVRDVVPFYTLDADIRLPDGRLLYPKGFTFNPLAYVHLAQRLIIVHPRDLAWALAQARPTDWILLAADGQAQVDPLALSQKVGRPLFILEAQVKDRLGLTVAPVIISQVDQKLELKEFQLRRAARGGAVL
jgi:conjugal transfer pilus assembly protein TraW